MLKDIKRGEWVETVEYELCFFDDENCGYAFPCDEQGNLMPDINEDARRNYELCMQHPELYMIFNKVHKQKRQWREPTTGLCSCGERIELWDEYYGACSCPKCNKWYNLFGQELLPPEQWEKDPADEEYWED